MRFDAQGTVLLVSTDETLMQTMEQLGSESLRLTVRSVRNWERALEVLSRVRVDLIVLHVHVGESLTEGLLDELRHHRRLAVIPVLALLESATSEQVADAIDAGAADCMAYPGSHSELAARLRALARVAGRHRRKLTERHYNLSGDLTALGFTDLIGLLELGRASGRLRLLTSDGEGRVLFGEGRVIHAEFGNLVGEEAFFELMHLEKAQYEFRPGDPAAEHELEATIDSTTASLVLRAATRFDEEQGEARAFLPAPLTAVPDRSNGEGASWEPDVSWAARGEALLEHTKPLGELQLLSRAAYQAWSVERRITQRIQIWLVTDLHCGVQALSAVATPLADEQVCHALHDPPEALVWSLRMDAETRLEVILIDQDRPRTLIDELNRRPVAMIVAPTHGDFQTLDLDARSGLIELLTRWSPRGCVSIGNVMIERHVKELATLANRPLPQRGILGTLWNLEVDLRFAIAESLRLWASSTPVAVEPAAESDAEGPGEVAA
ncbi:MAG: DUF4388 domain-containing protein [Candidatus Eisenbacteria bacterium]|uniref:DUF4388 domain-containing protein n=1 Tax=Eiseniibacteriota bacterium TaxID=2212470 RepID=A0A849SI31_UNCEI|nr:DUF4388 domain-containing protein [Candidatus Eisenbacteria bacterium]